VHRGDLKLNALLQVDDERCRQARQKLGVGPSLFDGSPDGPVAEGSEQVAIAE